MTTVYLTELFCVIGAIGLIMTGSLKRDISRVQLTNTAIVILGFIIGLAFYNLYTFAPTSCATEAYICADSLSMSVKPLLISMLLVIVIISSRYVLHQHMPVAEFYSLALLSTCGVLVLLDSQSIVMLYLALELISLPSYIMCALAPNDSLGKEAAMKYFIIGSIGSGLVLFGLSWLYGLTGVITLSDISKALLLIEVDSTTSNAMSTTTLISASITIMGVLIKLGVAPLHWWVADTYQGANTPTTLFLSTIPKFGAATILFKLLHLALSTASLQENLCQALVCIGLFSIFWGNFLALTQHNLKRLLAYSSISHMGIVVVALSMPKLYLFDFQMASIAYAYLLIYSLATLITFYVIIEINQQSTNQITLSDISGLNQTCPTLAFFLLIAIFSTASIPPLAGFFAKLPVLSLMIDHQYVNASILLMLLSAIGVGYYINIIRTIYFIEPSDNQMIIHPHKLTHHVVSFIGLAVVVFAIYPNGIILHYFSRSYLTM